MLSARCPLSSALDLHTHVTTARTGSTSYSLIPSAFRPPYHPWVSPYQSYLLLMIARGRRAHFPLQWVSGSWPLLSGARGLEDQGEHLAACMKKAGGTRVSFAYISHTSTDVTCTVWGRNPTGVHTTGVCVHVSSVVQI